MTHSRKYKLTFVWLALLPALVSLACSGTPEPAGYPIAPEVLNLYETLGGEESLGIGIYPSYVQDGVLYQYTVAAVLAYDTQSGATYLVPLTKVWHVDAPDEPMPADDSIPYVNGHQIWGKLIAEYEAFGQYAWGLPVTGVQHNDGKGRSEQYFERAGFYVNDDDPLGTVHMLPYGDWACGSKCSYEALLIDGIVDLPPVNPEPDVTLQYLELVFMTAADRWGWSFIGRPMGDTYLSPDGFYEKPFENCVMYTDISGLWVKLRPLGNWWTASDPPAPCEPGMYCYAMQGEMGYSIPIDLKDYILLHGGIDVWGVPITQARPNAEGGLDQCFTNACLGSNPNAVEELRIQPFDLGRQYKLQSQPPVTEDAPLALYIRPRYPFLDPGQVQEIEITVYRGNAPLAGANATLWVDMPDGSTQTYLLAPTDANGQSWVAVPVGEPDLNTIFEFGVCLIGITNPPLCEVDSFSIWDAP